MNEELNNCQAICRQFLTQAILSPKTGFLFVYLLKVDPGVGKVQLRKAVIVKNNCLEGFYKKAILKNISKFRCGLQDWCLELH